MTTATTLTDLTATEIAAAVRAGELSPVEVAEAVIEAVDALNSTLNAFCILGARATSFPERGGVRRAERRCGS
ncbi:hypothetical protein [Streptomyces sp. NPDC059460]|uniref:hypothetical protein n=1 Tax=Streptomyces sp. NPDC059460 TaxID=3346840 RepID=UPI003682D1B0